MFTCGVQPVPLIYAAGVGFPLVVPIWSGACTNLSVAGTRTALPRGYVVPVRSDQLQRTVTSVVWSMITLLYWKSPHLTDLNKTAASL